MNNGIQIYLFDFDDSFTFNIYSELKIIGLACEVIPLNRLTHFFQTFLLRREEPIFQENVVFIYGPGPGHISEYDKYFEYIKVFLLDKTILHFGICLGHQLLWSILGASIIPMEVPIHGHSRKIEIPDWKNIFSKEWRKKECFVQFYNSWCVFYHIGLVDKFPKANFYFQGKQLLMGQFENILTYQFHPESVGTSFPRPFFEVIGKFFYNRVNERAISQN